MKIKCPQCSATNEVQKYCGNCGSVLLKDGVEIEATNKPPKQRKKLKRWLVGFLIFLGVSTIGTIVVDILVASASLESDYNGAISVILGLIIWVWYGMDLNGSEPTEEENTRI